MQSTTCVKRRSDLVKKIRVFITAGISFVMILVMTSSLAGQASAADEYDTLRSKWKEALTGGSSYSLTDAEISAQVSLITSTAQTHWNSMDTSSSRTYLWSDQSNIPNDSGQLNNNFIRLKDMALAYSTYGSSLNGNSTLLSDIMDGLDWLYANYYNENSSMVGNWWNWEIGIPRNLSDTMVMLYDHLTSTQITNYVKAMDKFCDDPTMMMIYNTNPVEATGANRVDKAINVALNGIVSKNSSKLGIARDALSQVFNYVTSGNGFYRDGSFIQHTDVPYNMSYGLVLIRTLPAVMDLLDGSTWEVTDPDQGNMYDWIYSAFEPLIYKGAAMDMTRGRAISRHNQQDHVSGHHVIEGIIRVAQFAPADDAAYFKEMVKYWLSVDTTRSFYEERSLSYILMAKAIMNDTGIASRGELIKHQQFNNMDRAVHLRPGFGFGLSMHSSRIDAYESMNSENLQGWYTSYGMTYLYNGDLEQYSDNYWPTVDRYRLPGTTVDTLTRSNSSGQGRQNESWVGGTSLLDTYGVSGMHLDAYGTSLFAKKSWFMFDDEIVALGSGISAASWRTIETIVENRKIDGSNELTVDGTVKSSSLGWSETMSGVDWIHLEGNTSDSDIGYYFPGSAAVKGLREARTGKWYDIRSASSKTEDMQQHTRNYMTLWFDHGINPAGEKYSYVLLPGKTSSGVSSYASSPDIAILENSEDAHAVKEITTNVTAVNFWNDAIKTVGLIKSNKKSSVMMKEENNILDISVSDPTHQNSGTIEIEIMRSGAELISADLPVTVTQLVPTIKLEVSTAGASGAGFHAQIRLPVPLVSDDFNSGTVGADPSGWTITEAANTNAEVANVPGSGDHSLKFSDSNNSGNAQAVHSFTPQTGLVIAEFKFMNPTVTKWSKIGNLVSGSTIAAELYAYDDNNPVMVYRNNSGQDTVIQNISTNTWYTVKLVADVSAKTYDIYVDGVLKVSNAPFRNTSVTSLDGILFSSGISSSGTLYADDVLVTSHDTSGTSSINETFDSLTTGTEPAGWTIYTAPDTSALVADIPSASDKSLKLYDRNTSEKPEAVKKFVERSGVVTAEFKFMAPEISKWSRVPNLMSGTKTAVEMYAFDDSSSVLLYRDNNSVDHDIMAISTNVWYTVKVIADTSTKTYDIYVNGVLKISNAPFKDSTITHIDSIYFSSGKSSEGTVYVDDISVN